MATKPVDILAEEFVRMVLYQAYDASCNRGPVDIYSEAWCLTDVDFDEYLRLKKNLLDNKYIEESGEPGYYKITQKGEDFANGNN